jgi:hypothetical protein
MIARKEYLRLRRQYLVSLAAAQRSEVAGLADSLQRRLWLADSAFAAVRSIYLVPVLAAAGVLLLARVPHKKIWRWGGSLIAAWRIFGAAYRRWSAL